MDFSNKVVVITGASSGIGETCAVEFAKLSAKLALVGRNIENLLKVAKECEQQKGIKALVIRADMSKDDDVERIVTKTVAEFGRIDVLLNNAGIGSNKGIRDGIKFYDEIIAVNTRAPYLLTYHALPHLTKAKGNIIFMSSVAGQKPVARVTPYCMSKAAIDMLTKCLSQELGPEGIRVNSVNPGVVKTPLLYGDGKSEEQLDLEIEYHKKMAPMRKITTTLDVADLVVFLASDKACSITGTVNIIDNGVSVKQ